MRPKSMPNLNCFLEATDVPGLKTQSPSTLVWRLRVEPRHTRPFETTVKVWHTCWPHGQSPRDARRLPLRLTRMGGCRIRQRVEPRRTRHSENLIVWGTPRSVGPLPLAVRRRSPAPLHGLHLDLSSL
jgi:hypothetical protein